MIGVRGLTDTKLFTYLRYNAELTGAGLHSLGLVSIAPEDVRRLDSVAHIAELQLIGKAVAKGKVSAEHFDGFVPPESGPRGGGPVESRGAPVEVSDKLDAKIHQGQSYEGNDLWKWWVWVEGPDEVLDRIDHVTYTLDRTFHNPIREVADRESKFRLETVGWGGFPVKALVVRKDGVKELLKHELVLTHPDGTVTTR